MPVSPNDLSEIDGFLSDPAADGGVLSALRSRFAHLTFLRCDATDVIKTPFAVYPKFDLHLVDSRDHCVSVVSDVASATGFLLAAR